MYRCHRGMPAENGWGVGGVDAHHSWLPAAHYGFEEWGRLVGGKLDELDEQIAQARGPVRLSNMCCAVPTRTSWSAPASTTHTSRSR
jgi:hypothetical protein